MKAEDPSVSQTLSRLRGHRQGFGAWDGLLKTPWHDLGLDNGEASQPSLLFYCRDEEKPCTSSPFKVGFGWWESEEIQGKRFQLLAAQAGMMKGGAAGFCKVPF